MSQKRWYGGGMYSVTPTRGPSRGVEMFYGKVWIKSEKRRRHFLLGPGFLQSKRKLAAIYADPTKSLLERAREQVRCITLSELLDDFLRNYRSRGGTPFYHHITKGPRVYRQANATAWRLRS